MVTQVTTIETNSSLEWYTITTHSNSILTSKKILINNGTSSSTQTFHEAINTFSNDSLQNSSKQPHNEKVSILTTNQTKEKDSINSKQTLLKSNPYPNSYATQSNSMTNRMQNLSTGSSSMSTDPSGRSSSSTSRFGGSEKSVISTKLNNSVASNSDSNRIHEEKNGITLNDLTKVNYDCSIFYQSIVNIIFF